MNKLLSLLTAFFLLAPLAQAAELGTAEVATVKADVKRMTDATERGDLEVIMELTHPSLIELMGGRERFAEVTRDAMTEVLKAGMKFESLEVGQPSRLYSAGEEEMCIVPRVSVINIAGTRVRSNSFVLAVRRVGGKTWTFLDGTGVSQHPEIVKRLLPSLEAGVKFPEVSVDKL